MDVFNRQQQHKLSKTIDDGIDDKVMVFRLPDIAEEGPIDFDFRFPFHGTITEVYVSCTTIGTEPTEIVLQKISESDYELESAPWSDITSLELIQKTVSTQPASILNSKVLKNDHFRIDIRKTGGAINLTIQVIVDVN